MLYINGNRLFYFFFHITKSEVIEKNKSEIQFIILLLDEKIVNPEENVLYCLLMPLKYQNILYSFLEKIFLSNPMH